MVLVMQYEVTISAYDLSSMLSHLERSSRKVDIYLVDSTILACCSILRCDEYILVATSPAGVSETHIPIASIKAIEFEGFHEYRGVCSKIFQLE